ncbi:reverse transcriptase domain-containing protein [Tanacetum coccineum]
MSKVLQERGYGNLPSSSETNPRDHVKSISTTVETDTTPIRHIGPSRYAEGSYELKDLDAYSIGTTLLDDALPTKEKDPGSFTLPCIINNLCFNNALADLRASVSVMPFSTYTKLGLGELAPTKLIVELADSTVKCPKGIGENVLVGIDKFVFPVDFIVLDMPEDIKTPLILGRPFLSTAHAKIDMFKRKITLRALSLKERMELDLEARLMGKALILNRSLDPLYGDYIELNDLNKPLDLKRNQIDDLEPTIEEGEVIDKSVKDIVKTRCDDVIVTGLDFVVVENMDSYRDEGMCDIIVERPFCKDAYIKARQFDGMITIYKGNDSVSAHDELKGISHPYQKLKGFYKVLNLGPEYIKDKKVEEWLTRGTTLLNENDDFGGAFIFWNSVCCSHAGI